MGEGVRPREVTVLLGKGGTVSNLPGGYEGFYRRIMDETVRKPQN